MIPDAVANKLQFLISRLVDQSFVLQLGKIYIGPFTYTTSLGYFPHFPLFAYASNTANTFPSRIDLLTPSQNKHILFFPLKEQTQPTGGSTIQTNHPKLDPLLSIALST